MGTQMPTDTGPLGELKPQCSHSPISQWATPLMMMRVCVCVCVWILYVFSTCEQECVDVWELVLWACIIVCGEVCVCLYIYEVLDQTFNLPQPSECAERRLSRCVLSPPSLPCLCIVLLFLPPSFSLLFFRTPFLDPLACSCTPCWG